MFTFGFPTETQNQFKIAVSCCTIKAYTVSPKSINFDMGFPPFSLNTKLKTSRGNHL